jgi:hypothetical protein
MTYDLIVALSALFLLPGFFMAFVPMLPALSYMFVVSLVFAFFDRFSHIGFGSFAILLGIVLLSVTVDHLSGVLGAKYGGAHGKSLLWGIFGSIVGTFVAPLLGSLAGLFLGVILSELQYCKGRDKALKSASSALLGSLAGIAVNVVLAFVFIILFISFAL